MEEALSGATEPPVITLNAERPRKGVFEVRVGETVIVSTGPEERPFPALKALDIDAVTESTADTAKAFYFLG